MRATLDIMGIGFFSRLKKKPRRSFDAEKKTPVLRCSICTGEQVAGFIDNETGIFEEERLIKNDGELSDFLAEYSLTDIKREY